MSTIFIISDPRRPSLHLTDKIGLRQEDKYIALLILSFSDTYKNF